MALCGTAALAGVVVTLAGLAVSALPILAIVGEPSAAPGWAIFSVDVRGLPLPHALAATEVVIFYLCVFAAKFLPAPVTMKQAATPPQKDTAARMATRQLLGSLAFLFESVGLDLKLLTANRAVKCWRGGVFLPINPLAGIGAEPEAGAVPLYLIRFPGKFFVAVRAVNDCVHGAIIQWVCNLCKFIACERLNRKCRGIEIAPQYVAVALERLSQMDLTPHLAAHDSHSPGHGAAPQSPAPAPPALPKTS